MSRFDDDIRRIAKRDKIKGALESKLERDPIFGTATPFITDAFAKGKDDSLDSNNPNTFYVSVNDDIGNSYSDNYGGTSEEGTFRGSGFSGDGFGDGGESSGNNSDVPKADEFYNQEAGPTNLDNSPISDIYPTGAGGYGTLTGLDDLYDCNTNDEYKVRFNGRHAEVNGWDDPAVPPPDPTWQKGYFWNGAGNLFASRGTAMAAAEAWAQAVVTSSFTFDSFVSGWFKHLGTWTKQVQVEDIFTEGFFYRIQDIHAIRYSCVTQPWGAGLGLCPDTAPALESCWGCAVGRTAPTSTSLVYKDGTYQTSEYDSNAKNEFNGRSVIELCGELDGQKRIQIEPSFDGGQIITAGNITKVISPAGRLVFAGDATESNKNAYRPPANILPQI
jgi:hypothetical protein